MAQKRQKPENELNKVFRFRMYPNRIQEQYLNDSLEEQRLLYNSCLIEMNYQYESQKDKPKEERVKFGTYELQKKIAEWSKSTIPSVLNLYSQSRNYVAEIVNAGYQKFFRDLKNKIKTSKPKFKKFGDWKSIHYPTIKNQFIPLPEKNRLYIPVGRPHIDIGLIRIVQHRDIVGEISSLALVKDGEDLKRSRIERNQIMQSKQKKFR